MYAQLASVCPEMEGSVEYVALPLHSHHETGLYQPAPSAVQCGIAVMAWLLDDEPPSPGPKVCVTGVPFFSSAMRLAFWAAQLGSQGWPTGFSVSVGEAGLEVLIVVMTVLGLAVALHSVTVRQDVVLVVDQVLACDGIKTVSLTSHILVVVELAHEADAEALLFLSSSSSPSPSPPDEGGGGGGGGGAMMPGGKPPFGLLQRMGMMQSGLGLSPSGFQNPQAGVGLESLDFETCVDVYVTFVVLPLLVIGTIAAIGVSVVEPAATVT